jgi:dienelactone hydrolase
LNKLTSVVETYITRPAIPTNKAIIIFSDIFGPRYPNTQLIADRFASHGYLTVVPDLFKGNAINPAEFASGHFDLQEWLTHHGTESVDPIVEILLDYLKNDLKVEKLAGVGYCFGGKVSRAQFDMKLWYKGSSHS